MKIDIRPTNTKHVPGVCIKYLWLLKKRNEGKHLKYNLQLALE